MKNSLVTKITTMLTLIFFVAEFQGQSEKAYTPLEGKLYSMINTGSYSTYLAKLDYQTGQATAISPTVIVKKTNPGLSAIDAVHGRFIVMSSFIDGGDTIYNIDLATGLIVNKNKATFSSTYFNEAFEYNCRDTTLYTIAEHRTSHQCFLSSIDPVTGVQTLISPMPIPGAGSGQSALDPVNRKFYYYHWADSLIGINLNTGLVSSRVKLSSGGVYAMPSMEYNSEDQTLYTIMEKSAYVCSTCPYPTYLAKINPNSGLVTMLSPQSVANKITGFQSGLDPVNRLFFFITADSLCAINLSSGTVAYKNKIYGVTTPQSVLMEFEKTCTQMYAGIETAERQTYEAKLFPNPLSTSAVIQLNQECKDAVLSIYDLTGVKVIETSQLCGKEITVERNNLAPGIYFVQLRQSDSLIFSEKFVVSD